MDSDEIQWSLQKTDTLGKWLLSVVESCPLLGDWFIILSNYTIYIILNAVLHLLRLNSLLEKFNSIRFVIRFSIRYNFMASQTLTSGDVTLHVLEINSYVRGYHAYMDRWTPALVKCLY